MLISPQASTSATTPPKIIRQSYLVTTLSTITTISEMNAQTLARSTALVVRRIQSQTPRSRTHATRAQIGTEKPGSQAAKLVSATPLHRAFSLAPPLNAVGMAY